MLTYEVLKESPKWLRAFTSLDAAEFEALLPAFDQVWQAYQREEERKRGKAYRRKSGGGRKVRLKRSEDKLVFILVYVKVYPLQEVQGQMFDLSQGQANVWIHILMPLLKAALGRKKQLPEREVHHLAETLAGSDGLDFIIDGTERRRQRPKNPLKQKEYYSSKKKAHTVKNNVIANADTQHVAYLSQTVPGKTHDKKLCDQEQYTFPALSLLEKDTGFQGYEPQGVITYQPRKKPKVGELSQGERFVNTVISSVRIVVEHVLAGIKRCRIVKDIFRNSKKNFDDLAMEIACGLHNFRNSFRHPVPMISLIEMASESYFQ